jgi:hypothetical protein
MVHIDTRYGLFAVLKSKGFILLCLPYLSSAPHELIVLLLEGIVKPRHHPLPAGREVAGIRLWEWRRQLERSLFCWLTTTQPSKHTTTRISGYEMKSISTLNNSLRERRERGARQEVCNYISLRGSTPVEGESHILAAGPPRERPRREM